VFYGAPDLAMTQFAIDTLTVVLFVFVLFKLPAFLNLSNRAIQFRDAVISIAFGVLISLITLQALVSPADKEISRFYAENAYELAKGKNVVNVILVDFRGFDTLIETIVLSIAAIGVFSLLKYRASDEEISE
jgi:multicomponent Na+:H+ antiporter subunit A